ncbi:MAG TPA: class I SAM-dependent rRNA methyltransferase [Gammaproteobacteria bacterium]
MKTIPAAYLKTGREKSLRRRHPWVFSGAVERVEGEPEPGATVRIVSDSGEFLAHAAYSPRSQIRLRVWTFAEQAVIDASFIERRLAAAIEARRALGLLEQSACRIAFAESDGLPGLIVDRYGSYLVCQFLAAGVELWRDAIVAGLEKLLSPRGIYERSEASARRKEGLPSRRGVLSGEAPPGRIDLDENGLVELVDVGEGQKTGAYLDQRVNRKRVAAYAKGAEVLDAYAHSGGFALSCLASGARAATLIDSSASALELAREQAARNGFGDRCQRRDGDVPTELRRDRAEGRSYDLVVLDPPKFVHTDKQIQAGSRAYKDINRLGSELVRPGGVLATFSCSGHVDAALFQKIVAGAVLDAGRDAQILERLCQPADHPIGIHFPEAEYLKGLVLRILA